MILFRSDYRAQWDGGDEKKQEIMDVLSQMPDTEAPSQYPGSTWEQGVQAALEWVCDMDDDDLLLTDLRIGR